MQSKGKKEGLGGGDLAEKKKPIKPRNRIRDTSIKVFLYWCWGERWAVIRVITSL